VIDTHPRPRIRRRGVVLIVLALSLATVVAVVAVAAILLARSRIMNDVAAPGSGGTEQPTVDAPELSTAELTLAAQARVLFGHQSVGDNILGGVGLVYEAAGVPPPSIVETRDPVPGADAFIAHTYVGFNGDPLGKLDDFVSVTSGSLGDDADVFLVKFCYVDVTAETDVQALFDAYVAAMEQVQEAHPDAVVLYTTVPLTVDRSGGVTAAVKTLLGRGDTSAADNTARAEYNALVREQFGETGRLVDVAALEAAPGSDPAALDPALTSDGGHLNEAGARAVAAELLRVIAANLPATSTSAASPAAAATTAAG
jgi:hypothetical protein